MPNFGGATPEIGVFFRINGLDQVRRGLKLVKDEAEPTGHKWGTASRQIASGLENIARQGKVTGESLKMVISSASQMAFAFGPQGAIVAALSITGMAIYEHITGNMKIAEEQAKKTADSIRDLVDAGDKAGLYKQMSAAWRGTPSNNFSDGVVGLEAQRDNIRMQRNTWTPDKGLPLWRRLAADLDTINEKIKTQRALFEQLKAAYNAPMPWQGAGMLPGMTSSAHGGSAVKPDMVNLLGRGTLDVSGFDRFFGDPDRVKMDPLNFTAKGAARPQDSATSQAMVEGMKTVGELAGKGFVDTFASTIESGISKAFEKGATLGGVFAAMAKSALGGIGSMMMQIGRATLASFAFIEKIKLAIMTLSPGVGIAASIGLIALGAALQGAAGRSSSGGGSGGGGYGGGYGSSAGYGSTIIDRGIIDPTGGQGVAARQSNTYNAMFFGHRDPVAQREFQEWVKAATSRGGT